MSYDDDYDDYEYEPPADAIYCLDCSECEARGYFPCEGDDEPEPEQLPGGECEQCGEEAAYLIDNDGELVCEECYNSRYDYGLSVEAEMRAERQQMGLINF